MRKNKTVLSYVVFIEVRAQTVVSVSIDRKTFNHLFEASTVVRVPCKVVKFFVFYTGIVCKVFVVDDTDCIPVFWKTVCFTILCLPEFFKVVHVDRSIYVVAFDVWSQINKKIFVSKIKIFCKVICEYIACSTTNHFCLKSSPVIVPSKLNDVDFDSWIFFHELICCCLISRELSRIPELIADSYFLAAFSAARSKSKSH